MQTAGDLILNLIPFITFENHLSASNDKANQSMQNDLTIFIIKPNVMLQVLFKKIISNFKFLK